MVRVQDVVITMLPYAILLGIWVFFMRKMGGRRGYAGLMDRSQQHIDRSFEYMKRTEEQLERIALALERIDAQRKAL